MSGKGGRHRRILAIDPTHRGFGYAVLEGPSRLVDWGVKDVRVNRDEGTIAKVRDLLEVYRPHVLVVEACEDQSAHRGPRAVKLIGQILALAREKNMKARTVPRRIAHARLVSEGAATKRAVVKAIVARFPELAVHQPPERKPWMSEDDRQAVFDATAFAVAKGVR